MGLGIFLFLMNVSRADIHTQYESLISQISKRQCSRGEEKKFSELFQRYLGKGFYVPELNDVKVDRSAIVKNLPLLSEKLAWIQKQKLALETGKGWRDEALIQIQATRAKLKECLDLKKRHRFAKTEDQKDIAESQSKKALKDLRSLFGDLSDEVSFLLSFQYPVDHFENRRIYEQIKEKATFEQRLEANELFLKRKILEDGSMEPGTTRSDLMLRTTLDSLGILIPEEKEFVSERVRYDLTWSLDKLTNELARGKSYWVQRLNEWELRTKDAYDFYVDLLHRTPAEIRPELDSDQIVLEKSLALFELRQFVLQNEAKLYEFLSKQSEKMQSLYVLDTILTAEVGEPRDSNYLDRRDVAQVVWNRKHRQDFSTLSPKESLYGFLNPKRTYSVNSYPWLNVLFKEGEFSFTYYFIPSVVRMFCPDRSKRGARIRKQNINLAQKVLGHPNAPFKAIRYFSRGSMVGKIDMGKIWSNYKPIEERPGEQIFDKKKLVRNLLQKGEFEFWYQFADPSGKKFDVLEVGGKPYSVLDTETDPKIYQYRDPHSFVFFAYGDKN